MMKVKNIFFGLLISMLFISETVPMFIPVTKRLHAISRSKRHYVDTTGQIIAEGLLGGWISYCIVTLAAEEIKLRWQERSRIQVANEIAHNKKKYLYNAVLDIGSFNCSSAHINKEKCQNSYCCRDLNSDQKKLELFKQISNKCNFLSEIKNNIQQLCDKEKEIELLSAQGEINAEKGKKIIAFIKHKKECHYQQVMLFEECKNMLDIERKGIETILEQLRATVEEEKKR